MVEVMDTSSLFHEFVLGSCDRKNMHIDRTESSRFFDVLKSRLTLLEIKLWNFF
jgi:hypothetical protein